MGAKTDIQKKKNQKKTNPDQMTFTCTIPINHTLTTGGVMTTFTSTDTTLKVNTNLLWIYREHG